MEKIAGKAKSINIGQVISGLKSWSTSIINRAQSIYNGPIKNSALVGREFLTLVAKEQQIAIPKATQWPEAREAYMRMINAFKPGNGVSWSTQLMYRMSTYTWADVVAGGKVLAQLGSLYFIAQLAGKTVTYPLSATRKN